MASAGGIARGLGELLLELLAPAACAACDAVVGARVLFCPACVHTVEPPAVGARVEGAFAYGGAVATAIVRMKYAGRPELAPRLGAAMGGVLAPRVPGVDAVVSVPLHPRRVVERGFDQAALLGVAVARALRVRFLARAIVRHRDTPRQATLDREARLVNVAGAFRPHRAGRLRGARLLLVDDVATTGATLRACGAALLAAGARSVRAAALAVNEDLAPPRET